jgi:CRP/FNR family cyclic AMP-dependent transcriptional regulator
MSMNSTTNPRTPVKDESLAVKAIASVLAEHPFLKGLKPEHLQVLVDNAMRMHYQPGDFIFYEGDPANRFYLIEKGKVLLEAHPRDEVHVPVQTIGAGDVLGWSWLFPPYHWHFDARALEPTTAIFIYGTRLREACEQDHDFGYDLMKRMTQVVMKRLQATRKQLLAAHA